MFGSAATRQKRKGDDLYDRIGAFLADQSLSVDPVNYAFAHHVLGNPGSEVARAVARLTDGGVRLQSKDVEEFGCTVAVGTTADPEDRAHQLVAETKAQVDGFASIMRALRDETRGFGRDLEQSAAAIERAPGAAGLVDIARITGTMLGRVRDAESRLAQATSEAEALRSELAEANDSARRDALTGLPNRRAFEEAFQARDLATGPYCLALCDIDRFKRVNDEYGHSVGDRVLSAIGRALVELCAGDLVVRHGGEEFAILLTATDLISATAKLQAACAGIAGKRFRNRETDHPLGQITVSIGVTAVREGEEAEAALDRADRLLYTAKANGRDQVSAA
ncbi:GGDEF domain-containing protein [Sphingomonas oligophenolica]|uniref:diguanylate cyclase n=1 Tax=Sphingomonas oligophenolica TaxID=301154 RepID=A0A502CNN4_9SPHN|nr:GGDEF domain-containing protein [Sphingomonas oligophenolica]TPG13739.1 diguanylate cyclase [Sphingomonas oligophenolica]